MQRQQLCGGGPGRLLRTLLPPPLQLLGCRLAPPGKVAAQLAVATEPATAKRTVAGFVVLILCGEYGGLGCLRPTACAVPQKYQHSLRQEGRGQVRGALAHTFSDEMSACR